MASLRQCLAYVSIIIEVCQSSHNGVRIEVVHDVRPIERAIRSEASGAIVPKHVVLRLREDDGVEITVIVYVAKNDLRE